MPIGIPLGVSAATRFRTRTRRVALLQLLVGLSGCSRNAPNQLSAHITTDSAGIEVVTSSAPETRDSTRYQVDSIPMFDFTGTHGASPGFVGIVPAVRTRLGWLVIADPNTRQVHFYGAEGQHIRAVGGEGSAPGEFRAIGYLGLMSNDSIVVTDPVLNRLTVLDPSGTVRRTVRIPELGPAAQMTVSGVFQDGAFLATTSNAVVEEPRAGVRRSRVPAVALNFDGTVRSRIGDLPGPDSVVAIDPDASVHVNRLAFGLVATFAAVDTLVAVGDGDGYQINILTRDGRLVRSICWRHDPVPVTSVDWDRYITYRRRSNPVGYDWQTTTRRELFGVPLRKTLPPYDLFLSRTNGELWVRAYAEPNLRTRRTSWSVFGRSGAWLADLTLPLGAVPLSIGTDAILATWRDEHDCIHLRVYRLRER